MTDAEMLVARLYTARRDKREARNAWVDSVSPLGECKNLDTRVNGHCYSELRGARQHWCARCDSTEDSYQAYRKAARDAAAALRAVLSAGKRLNDSAGTCEPKGGR